MSAVDLSTLEVSWFPSQNEAERVLGLNRGSVNAVIRGKHNQTGSYWFTNADEKSVDAIKKRADIMELSERGIDSETNDD